jgi:ClpP class serine protease
MTIQPSPNDIGNGSSRLASGMPKPSKTPLFEANNSARYNRQSAIRQIQDRTGRRLICYVSGAGPQCAIDSNDVAPFVDLLHNVPENHDLDLLLHTNGGSIDAAERLMGMLRSRVGIAELRIIVPDSAKSAGTLMVLGADSVVMSDMSELGPIDPQAYLSGKWQSVQHYLDAYEEHSESLKSEPRSC